MIPHYVCGKVGSTSVDAYQLDFWDKKPQFVVFVNFHGIVTQIMANYGLFQATNLP